jgi:hypothetical protein
VLFPDPATAVSPVQVLPLESEIVGGLLVRYATAMTKSVAPVVSIPADVVPPVSVPDFTDPTSAIATGHTPNFAHAWSIAVATSVTCAFVVSLKCRLDNSSNPAFAAASAVA